MRIVRSWLKEWVSDLPPTEELIGLWPALGYEVAVSEAYAPGLEPVVLGRIVSREPIASSDHLARVEVEAGSRSAVVVTGAANGFPGDLVWWAPPGTVLPTGQRLEREVLRGTASEGMLCSAEELGFRPGAEDLWIWRGDGKPGDRWVEVMGRDWVYDLEVTPNLAQFAQSVRGVARDLEARAGRFLPDLPMLSAEPAAGMVELAAPDRCPHYALLALERPTGDLPWSWQRRLQAVGIRLVSPVVDLTNYVMWETGQPLHAFDADRVRLPIVVRLAETGEALTLLDGRRVVLTADDLVIADQGGPLALAGVMGGRDSAIGPDTRRILVESAHFAAAGIYRTSRRHGLPTDAAERFFRGTDPECLTAALHRLWRAWPGGPAAAPTAWVAGGPPPRRRVPFDGDRIRRLLGGAWSDAELEADLARLGLRREGEWVVVPGFRPDIEGVADLAEEVGRMEGLDAIPETMPAASGMARIDPDAAHRDAVRDLLVAAGYDEVMTRSLIAQDAAAALHLEDPVHRVANPLREEESVLRASLLPGLMQTVQFNRNRSIEAQSLFEVGAVYRGTAAEPAQVWQLGVVATLGTRRELHGGRTVGVYDLTGLVDGLARRLHWSVRREPGDDVPWLHPGRSQSIVLGADRIGAVGELHPALADQWRVPPLAVLLLDIPPAVPVGLTTVARPSRFPAVVRDLSLLWPPGAAWAAADAAIRAAGGPWLEQVRPFDRFAGDFGTSLAVSLTFQAEDRTLTEPEVDRAVERILDALAALDIRLRR